jgi:hypothetical protein
MFPLGGTTRSNSTGPPVPRRRHSRGLAVVLVIDGRGGRRGDDQGRRQPQLEQRAIFDSFGLEPLGGRDRHFVVQALVRPVGVVLLDRHVDRGLSFRHGDERLRSVEELGPERAVEPLHLRSQTVCQGRMLQPPAGEAASPVRRRPVTLIPLHTPSNDSTVKILATSALLGRNVRTEYQRSPMRKAARRIPQQLQIRRRVVRSVAEQALEPVRKTEPGIIVLDHGLAGSLTGLDAAPLLKKLAPRAKIILFTAHAELRTRAAAEPAVDAFLLKTDPTRLLPLAQRLTGLDAQST